MTLEEFRTYLKRKLGYPYVKVELHNDQINDAITDTLKKYEKWAVGLSKQEVFFTKVLSGGQRDYILPDGIIEVVDTNDSTQSLGSTSKLFTIQNQMYNAGFMNFLNNSGFSLIDYHLGLDYLDSLNKYTVSSYAWSYHKYNNTLTLTPVPSAGINWTNSDINFILIRGYILEGYDLDGTNQRQNYLESLYEDDWIKEYALALCKITLGYTRRKFENFQSIGNTGINLDGDQLISEGKEEKEALEERLKSEELGDGWGISIG